jgi:hypothetical protein
MLFPNPGVNSHIAVRRDRRFKMVFRTEFPVDPKSTAKTIFLAGCFHGLELAPRFALCQEGFSDAAGELEHTGALFHLGQRRTRRTTPGFPHDINPGLMKLLILAIQF